MTHMKTVHDGATFAELKQRISSLTPNHSRRWGTMSIDQMLWHVNRAMEMALGTLPSERAQTPPLPKFVLKFFLFQLPWPKGVPTMPSLRVAASHDFATEKARALTLLATIAARPVDAQWPENATFGTFSGTEWSRLQAKHLDHHLRQFGA